MVVEGPPDLTHGLFQAFVEEERHVRVDLDLVALRVDGLDRRPVEGRQDHVDPVHLALVDEVIEAVPALRVRQAEAVSPKQVHAVPPHPAGVPCAVVLLREDVRLAAEEAHGRAVLEDELPFRRVAQEAVFAAWRFDVAAGVEDALPVQVGGIGPERDPAAGIRVGEAARLTGLMPAPGRQVRVARPGHPLWFPFSAAHGRSASELRSTGSAGMLCRVRPGVKKGSAPACPQTPSVSGPTPRLPPAGRPGG